MRTKITMQRWRSWIRDQEQNETCCVCPGLLDMLAWERRQVNKLNFRKVVHWKWTNFSEKIWGAVNSVRRRNKVLCSLAWETWLLFSLYTERRGFLVLLILHIILHIPFSSFRVNLRDIVSLFITFLHLSFFQVCWETMFHFFAPST